MKRFCAGDIMPYGETTFRETQEEKLPNAIASHLRNDHRLINISAAIVHPLRSNLHDVAI